MTGPFGSAIGSRFFVSEGVPVIRGNNLSLARTKFIDDGFVFLTEKKAEEFRNLEARPGDLIFTAAGTIGQVGLIPARPRYRRYIISNKQMRARLDTAVVEPLFAYYWFTEPYVRHYIQSRNTGSTIPLINLSVLRALPLPVPPIDVQRAILGIVGALDDRIDLLRQTNATLEAIAEALFKSWFIDFDPVHAKAAGREPEGMDAATAALFPAEFEESELGMIPKGWRVLPFLKACDLIGGAQPPASTFVDSAQDGYVRLLQIRDFATDAHLTFIPDSPRLKRVEEDDVLIGRYGSASGDKQKDSLGRVCRGLAGAYNVALMKLAPLEVGREFALQLVSAESFYHYLQGVSAKAVQSGFSKSELGNLKVVVPPMRLAERYEEFGLSIWKSVKEKRKQARALEGLRDSLLPRLISGKLRLPEAREQLAEAQLEEVTA